jgi:gamma-glutamyltranspeptidase
LRGRYRGAEIISAPPPSSGGTALIETLNILESFDLGQAADTEFTQCALSLANASAPSPAGWARSVDYLPNL